MLKVFYSVLIVFCTFSQACCSCMYESVVPASGLAWLLSGKDKYYKTFNFAGPENYAFTEDIFTDDLPSTSLSISFWIRV